MKSQVCLTREYRCGNPKHVINFNCTCKGQYLTSELGFF